MTSLYEVLKRSKTAPQLAPDMFTALWAKSITAGKTIELSGQVPLSFKANGAPLIDYLISGNTVQSGTPSPDNPIVPQETGERTGNLINNDNIEQGGLLAAAGTKPTKIENPARCRYNYFFPVSSKNVLYDFKDLNVNIVMMDSDGLSLGGSGFKTGSGNFTLLDDAVKISLIIANSNSTDNITPSDVQSKNISLDYGFKIPISSANTTTPVYLGEVETTRKIKKLVLTGQETVIQSVVTNCVQIDVADTILNAIIYSSHFQYVITVPGETARNGKVFHAGGAGAGSICFGTSSTPSNFKQWLSAQYSAGTPVTVWYVLSTPTTGIVNEPLRKIGDYADTVSMEQAGVQIPTNKGSTTLDVLTTVKPSNVSIKYRV